VGIPKDFRKITCCEYCKHISWISRKDAWCTKHEFDLNPANEVSVLKICDDFELGE
jgi:hypothetical protein